MVRRFTTKLKTEKVEIEHDDGKILEYTITELQGPDLSEYMDEMNANTQISPTGEVQMTSFKGAFTSLLKRCLKNADGQLVDVKVIDTWPASTQRGLFDIAQELNNINLGASEAAKND